MGNGGFGYHDPERDGDDTVAAAPGEMTPAEARRADPNAPPAAGIVCTRQYEDARGRIVQAVVPANPRELLPAFRGFAKAKVNIGGPTMPGVPGNVSVDFYFFIPVPAEPWHRLTAAYGYGDPRLPAGVEAALADMVAAAYERFDAAAEAEAKSERLRKDAYAQYLASLPPQARAALDARRLTDATGQPIRGQTPKIITGG